MELDWLWERFAGAADKTFIVANDQPFTYRWLLDQIGSWRPRLDEAGIAAGTVVSIEGDYSPRSVAALLALIERAAIVVPLTASVEAQKPAFREIAEVQAIVSFQDDPEGAVRATPRAVRNPLTASLIAAGAPGLVLFSSGSTGKSKAALHNFAFLLEKFKRPRPTFVSLTFLLFDHIGGMNTLLFVLANTGTIIAVDRRDPEEVCRLVERYKVELLPTSPTFLNLLLISEAHRRYDLSSLKRITYGTEVMPARTLERLNAILPGVEFQQTYGLSELGIMRSKSRSSDSLWVKVGGEGFQTRIVDNTLWIKAESAMLGYLNAPSPFDEDGWFNTSDIVEQDGEYIKILGRQSEIINVGGNKVYPIEVESVLMQLPNVRDVAVAGEPNPITGQIVVARFNLFAPEEIGVLRKRVRAFCRERLESFKVPAKILIVEDNQFSERFKKMRRVDPA